VSTTGGVAAVILAAGAGVGPGVGVARPADEADEAEATLDNVPGTVPGLKGAEVALGNAPGNAPGQAAPGTHWPGSVAVGATITTARTAAVSVVAARAAAPRVDMVIAR
jgi:hypothetical protein